VSWLVGWTWQQNTESAIHPAAGVDFPPGGNASSVLFAHCAAADEKPSTAHKCLKHPSAEDDGLNDGDEKGEKDMKKSTEGARL